MTNSVKYPSLIDIILSKHSTMLGCRGASKEDG